VWTSFSSWGNPGLKSETLRLRSGQALHPTNEDLVRGDLGPGTAARGDGATGGRDVAVRYRVWRVVLCHPRDSKKSRGWGTRAMSRYENPRSQRRDLGHPLVVVIDGMVGWRTETFWLPASLSMLATAPIRLRQTTRGRTAGERRGCTRDSSTYRACNRFRELRPTKPGVIHASNEA